MAQRHGGIATRDPLRPVRPGLAERLAHDPAPAAVGHRHQCVGGRRVLGESPPAARHVRPRPPGARRPRAAARRAAASRSRAPPGVGRARRRTPTRRTRSTRRAASRIVRHPVQRHRWASRARSHGVSSGDAPSTSEGGQAHDDPRRAEAALAGAHRGEGVGPRVADGGIEAVEGGHLTAGHASGRGHTGHPRLPRRPTPCSTRTGPGGCTRPWASGDPDVRAGPRGAMSRRRGPRRRSPSTRRDSVGADSDAPGWVS